MKIEYRVGDVILTREQTTKIKVVSSLCYLESFAKLQKTHKKIKNREFIGKNA